MPQSAITPSTSRRAELLAAALKVRNHSHHPCTGIAVGAAAIDDRGQIHAACNVENHIVGVSLCSERILMGMMIASGGKSIKEVVVVSDHSPAWVPCGVCRQALAEFCASDVAIHCADLQGHFRTFTMEQLLPFTSDYLEK